jgi:hypothetical protein
MEINSYLKRIFEHYDIENTLFLNRYLPFNLLEEYLELQVPDLFKKSVIGHSELGKPIYALDFGTGAKKILLWSQMHGNEGTTTKAILDFINYIKEYKHGSLVKTILHNCTIRIIPMLNPDGASLYTRLNAREVDLNRDAVNKSQSETKAFFENFSTFKPQYCFNLHGQRTIFGVGETQNSSTMSFLAPSYDNLLSVDQHREKAMKLIVSANELLRDLIPNQIGRYDDTHNINCFGDYIQSHKVPTVLFEAGHYPNDYCRNKTRKFVTMSLLKMIFVIANANEDVYDISSYHDIPLNKQSYFDIIVKNVKNSDSQFIGIQYNEVLKDGRIEFIPYIKSLDELSSFNSHRSIDAFDKPVFINGLNFLEENILIKSIRVGSDQIEISINSC